MGIVRLYLDRSNLRRGCRVVLTPISLHALSCWVSLGSFPSGAATQSGLLLTLLKYYSLPTLRQKCTIGDSVERVHRGREEVKLAGKGKTNIKWKQGRKTKSEQPCHVHVQLISPSLKLFTAIGKCNFPVEYRCHSSWTGKKLPMNIHMYCTHVVFLMFNVSFKI